MKIEVYRRLGRLRSLERLDDFRQELRDRFGPLPPPAENLLAEAELRILAERWQLERIHVEDEYAVLTYRNARRIADPGEAPPRPRPDRRREDGLRPPRRRREAPQGLGRRGRDPADPPGDRVVSAVGGRRGPVQSR